MGVLATEGKIARGSDLKTMRCDCMRGQPWHLLGVAQLRNRCSAYLAKLLDAWQRRAWHDRSERSSLSGFVSMFGALTACTNGHEATAWPTAETRLKWKMKSKGRSMLFSRVRRKIVDVTFHNSRSLVG